MSCQLVLEVHSPAGRLPIIQSDDPGLLQAFKQAILGTAFGACVRWEHDITLRAIAQAELRRLQDILDAVISDE